MMRRISLAGSVAGLFLMAAVAQAVKPQAWTDSSQKDYAGGTFDGTVVDSYGQLTLGRDMAPIHVGDSAEMVTGFAQTADGTLYAAVNPDGRIVRLSGEHAKVVFNARKGFTDITALATDAKGNLLVAFAGKTARLVRFNPADENAKPVTVFQNENVDNIWAIAQAPDGSLYLGTGPHGKVYHVTAAGTEGTTVLESTSTNVTALAFDQGGNLIVGTDAKGLVIRLDLKTHKPFVLLDAGRVDVNAIVVGKDGSLYIATARAEEQEPPESDQEPETKSKPSTPEPDAIEPADDDAADNKNPGAAAPLPPFFPRAILGVNNPSGVALPPISPELKKLLNKAMADGGKDGPSGKRKAGLPAPHRRAERRRPAPSPDDSDEGGGGNSAVYRIAPGGAVTPLVQQADLNYSLLLVGDDLYVGTGNEGKLYRYRLGDQSLTLLARLKQEHVTALFTARDDAVLVGTANMGMVYRMGAGLAKTGTFTSAVMDAGHSAVWGNTVLDVLPALPAGTKATISTRSGNTRNVTGGDGEFWSDWSPEIDGPTGGKVTSPEARYLQYRITLTADEKAAAAPVVNRFHLAWQTENLAPRIRNVAVSIGKSSSDGDDAPDDSDPSADTPSPEKVATVNWDAADPNGDTLSFRIMVRRAGLIDGKPDAWTQLAKDIKDSSYDWDTRGVADGKYQVKVMASDRPDNPAPDAREVARVSAPFLIDHTPPVLGELKASANGNKATISGDATDATSTVADVRYQIDGQGDWQPAACSDKIFDSAHEGFSIVTAPLGVGAHRIAVRATDAAGNNSYKTVTVVVKP